MSQAGVLGSQPSVPVIALTGDDAVCALATLIASQEMPGREDQGAPMTQAEFHARAWKAANAKARELGWIV